MTPSSLRLGRNFGCNVGAEVMSLEYPPVVVVSSDVDEADGGVCEDDVGQREVSCQRRNKDDSEPL